MHHVFESKSYLCFATSIDDRNNVLQVNVFYHETEPGLLKCDLNRKAVSEIQQELLKHSNRRSKDTSASTSGQGTFSIRNPSTWKMCSDKNLVDKDTTGWIHNHFDGGKK